MSDRIASVLARTATLAGDRGLEDVQRFLAALPPGDDPAVLLLGVAGADVDGLSRWITGEAPDVPVRSGGLESAGAGGVATLAPNRVVVVLRCGTLLQPDAVEVAGAIVSRPPGSFAVVLAGAEVLRDTDDLDLVRRGLWRVLLGDPGVDWSGQDLAERGCLLWSRTAPAPTGAAVEVAERVSGDMRRLRQWVLAGPPPVVALAQMRARHALDLAERELARRVPPPRHDGGSADLEGLRSAAADLRDRLLARLDADLRVTELQLAASLEMLEQDLLAGVRDHLDRQPRSLSGPALTASVSTHLAEGGRRWRIDAARLVEERVRRTGSEAADLLDRVDWDAVNVALGRTAAGAYPALIVRRLEPRAPVSTASPAALVGPLAPGPTGPAWLPTLRRAAYGAVGAAAAAAVLGPVLLPAAAIAGPVAAGVLGAAGGVVVDQRLTGARDRRAALSHARAAIAATMGDFAREVRSRVGESAGPIRRAVDEEFAELDAALRAAAGRAVADRAAAAPVTAGAPTDAALLARLRAELTVPDPDE
jgi:hypothetical protein